MIRAHAAAVVAACDQAHVLNTSEPAFYDLDDVPDAPSYPYGVVYPDTGRPAVLRMATGSPERAWRVIVIGVGTTADEARIVLEKTEDALAGTRLAILGRRCSPLRLEAGQGLPVARDADLRSQDGLPVYTGSTVWTFGSSPTA